MVNHTLDQCQYLKLRKMFNTKVIVYLETSKTVSKFYIFLQYYSGRSIGNNLRNSNRKLYLFGNYTLDIFLEYFDLKSVFENMILKYI